MKVKIKTWKQMEKEYGLNSLGNIICDDGFLKEMEKQLPKSRIINIEKLSNKLYWNGWFISNDMILKYY